MKDREKTLEYTMKIHGAIGDLLSDKDGDFYIDPKELDNWENCKAFFNALSNSVPNLLYNKMKDDELSILDYNHFANRLCFEYCEMEKEKETTQKP